MHKNDCRTYRAFTFTSHRGHSGTLSELNVFIYCQIQSSVRTHARSHLVPRCRRDPQIECIWLDQRELGIVSWSFSFCKIIKGQRWNSADFSYTKDTGWTTIVLQLTDPPTKQREVKTKPNPEPMCPIKVKGHCVETLLGHLAQSCHL